MMVSLPSVENTPLSASKCSNVTTLLRGHRKVRGACSFVLPVPRVEEERGLDFPSPGGGGGRL